MLCDARSFERLPAGFGASSDLDLSSLAGVELEELLWSGLAEHKLLAFRSQHLNNVDLRRIIAAVGQPLPSTPAQFRVPGFPELTIVSNIHENGIPIGLYDGDDEEEWHCDHSYLKAPPSASLLYSVISAQSGGATVFCDTHAALQDLSDVQRLKLTKLQALHSLKVLDAAQRAEFSTKRGLSDDDASAAAWHDVVANSKFSGASGLLLGTSVIGAIRDGGTAQSMDIIRDLERYCLQKEYLYGHRWRDNDLILWDNALLMHTASPCDSKTNARLLYRGLSV